MDAHQDVMARAICGEGIPNFYAREIIADATCVSAAIDPLLENFFDNHFGHCVDMESYGYDTDDEGNYLLSDC